MCYCYCIQCIKCQKEFIKEHTTYVLVGLTSADNVKSKYVQLSVEVHKWDQNIPLHHGKVINDVCKYPFLQKGGRKMALTCRPFDMS
jgi:hypothetical protein